MAEKKTENNRKKLQKKYQCLQCNFFSDDKRDYKKHLETKKHIKKNRKTFTCIYCNKYYNYASGLSKHKKKCLLFKNKNDELKKENEELKIMLKKILSTQSEFMSSQKDFFKNNTHQQITNNTINNTYNKMSINIFLNEKCKNAMNLTDFVNQITISLDDLEYTKDNGFAKGIANILKKQLQDLNPTERPIHCSDKKRLQFYVKDEGKWEKDENHIKIDKSIQDVQKAQIQKMYDWEQNNPAWKTNPTLIEEWSKIVHGITGSGVKEEKSKKEIKRNISSHIDVKEELSNK